MPSHLTRHVFRCLLSNEYILHPGCLRRQAPGTLQRWRQARQGQHGTRAWVSHNQQRRTLFSFPVFSRSSREDAGISFDPGIEEMMDLSKRQRMKARLPEAHVIRTAIDNFVKAKMAQASVQIPDTQALLLLESYRYLIECKSRAPQEEGEARASAQSGTVATESGAELMRRQSENVTTAHLELARLLYETRGQHSTITVDSPELASLVEVLCCLGKPAEALDVLMSSVAVDKPSSPSKHPIPAAGYWGRILDTFSAQENEAGMLATLRAGQCYELEESAMAIRRMIVFYAGRHDASNLEKWFSKLCDEPTKRKAFAQPLRAALECCWQTKRLELGHSFVRNMMQSNPSKLVWDEILVWGFMLQKSVDEINRMMDVMIESNRDRRDRTSWRLPDTATINRLVETAIANKDPYIAERLINLGKDRGIEPDARTLCLQMQYRLDVNDVDGALIAYKHLQSKDLSSFEDIPAVNQLIVALCKSGRHSYDTIMNVAADLSDRRAAFKPLTVQTLAMLHLKRDEIQDVQDLIKTHAHKFSSTDRASLRGAIKNFCLKKTTPVANMWDGYNILRQDFDEMPREERVQIMQGCFKRKRADMAVHVFNHMRLHSRDDTVPNTSAYVAAFLGVAQVKDQQALRALHNQLKLDTSVDSTTRVRNALMIAYTACRQGEIALSIWDDIVDSEEGPSYSSIHIAFRACERTSFADVKAREIWARLRRNGIDLDQKLWASYIAALVGNGDVAAAVATLRTAYQKDEVELDPLMLGSLYNAAILTGKHNMIAAWASAEHSEAWARLQEVGMAAGEYRVKSYQVDRSVKP